MLSVLQVCSWILSNTQELSTSPIEDFGAFDKSESAGQCTKVTPAFLPLDKLYVLALARAKDVNNLT